MLEAEVVVHIMLHARQCHVDLCFQLYLSIHLAVRASHKLYPSVRIIIECSG